MSKVMTMVVMNKTKRPVIKIKSAIFSYFSVSLSLLLRIERKDKRLLVIKDTVAIAVNSSYDFFCRRPLLTTNSVSPLRSETGT